MMKTILLLCLGFLCMMLVLNIRSYAAQNPMFSGSKKVLNTELRVSSGIKKKVLSKIVPIQRQLNRHLTRLIKQAKTDRRMVFIILLVSFVYGFLHSLGPGHGKLVMSSYFLAKKSRPIDGIRAGFIVGLTHGAMAIILICAIYFILKLSLLRTFENTARIMAVMSYSVLICIGGILAFKAIYTLIQVIRGKKNPSDDEHTHHHHTGYLPLSFITGLVPCPGAATMVIFSITTGTFFIGILSVLAMSLGMAFVISFFALLAVYAKQTFFTCLKMEGRYKFYIYSFLSIAGAVSICLVGFFLLLANLNLNI